MYGKLKEKVRRASRKLSVGRYYFQVQCKSSKTLFSLLQYFAKRFASM